MYPIIHHTIHMLETQLAEAMNSCSNDEAKQALEHAHNLVVHQVAEYVRTAESRLTHT